MKAISGKKYLCALALCAGIAPAMADVIYSQDFEGGTPGWTFDSFWHVTANAPASGKGALGYVHDETASATPDGSYAGTNGSQFNAFSGVIALTNSNHLLFDARVDDEIGDAPDSFDRLSIGISLDGINFGTVVASSNPGNGGVNITENDGYHSYDVDLSAFANQNIYLSFGFATFDGVDDAHPGPRIDNILITGAAVPEPSSIALLGLGLTAMWRRRSRKA